MELIHILLTALGSLAALFLMTKLMGNRQMSQLSMFDYIIGITIGSIAAEMATALEDDFLQPLLAMAVYALFAVLFSVLTGKSIKLRRVLTGETLILLDNGKLFTENFKRAKMDLSEFLSQCRNSGYFDIANIQTAMLEPNGKISFLPVEVFRPATPQDLQISPQQQRPVVNVILDGKVLPDNLKFTGPDDK
ncbi:MAG: DUF421 domain-containing protein, partial [Eubacteriales bacterium]|nr:DUF421 domain-containing protein [Eubacteriales bacterium]